MKLRNLALLASATALLTLLTGCLKTRSQLRDDDDEDRRPVPAKVQEVQPQGAYVIDEIKSEMTRLQGRVEDVERTQRQETTQHNKQAKEQIQTLENRVQELEQAQAQMLEAIKKIQSSAPVADQPDVFNKGKNEYKAGKFDDAAETLSDYLKAPKGKHIEEATFLRGESYFALKQYKKAILDYSKFPEKFTSSRKLPTALFKIGQSFEALGMKEDAKGFYLEVVEKFPKSPEATKAKKKVK
jgi:tol-pal system protein YbgF